MPDDSDETNPTREEEAVQHFQFFTTDYNVGGSEYWFPIDHFFYALGSGSTTEDQVVYLETHASVRNDTGIAVSLIHGENREEYDNIPSALRRMADVIEEHTKNAQRM